MGNFILLERRGWRLEFPITDPPPPPPNVVSLRRGEGGGGRPASLEITANYSIIHEWIIPLSGLKLETLRGWLLIMVIKHGAPLSGIFG